MTPFDPARYREIIRTRFDGVLTKGRHEPDSRACALEAYAVTLEVPWTDDPWALGIPDLRPLNDAAWSSDQARTDAMIPLVVALSGWTEWGAERQRLWAQSVAIGIVREIIAELPGIPEAARAQCRAVETLAQAATAASYTAKAAASVVQEAAGGDVWWWGVPMPTETETVVLASLAAARMAEDTADAAADYAAWAAARAARAAARAADAVIGTACRIWIDAATETEPRD